MPMSAREIAAMLQANKAAGGPRQTVNQMQQNPALVAAAKQMQVQQQQQQLRQQQLYANQRPAAQQMQGYNNPQMAQEQSRYMADMQAKQAGMQPAYMGQSPMNALSGMSPQMAQQAQAQNQSAMQQAMLQNRGQVPQSGWQQAQPQAGFNPNQAAVVPSASYGDPLRGASYANTTPAPTVAPVGNPQISAGQMARRTNPTSMASRARNAVGRYW